MESKNGKMGILTFSGTQCPATVSPPRGVSRKKVVAAGGYMRNDSSSTAARYGSLGVVLNVISLSVANVERISSARCFMAGGDLHR